MSIDERAVISSIQSIAENRSLIIDPDTDLFESRILDSLGLMQLALALSEKSGIEIPPGAIARDTWRTVRSIVRFFADIAVSAAPDESTPHVVFDSLNDAKKFVDPMPFLTKEKWVVPVGSGSFAYSGFFLRVFRGIQRYMEELGHRHGAVELVYPPLWPIELFERLRYAEDFPELMLLAAGVSPAARPAVADKFKASAGTHRVVLDSAFSESEFGLAPAVCDLCYWRLRDSIVQPGAYTVGGSVFRNEKSTAQTLDRLTGYFVRDIVFVGDKTYVHAKRDELVQNAIEFVKRLNLDCRIATANDPFFGNAAAKSNLQHSEKLKFEIRAHIDTTGRDIAVGSINYHLDFFGRAFNISLKDGTAMHSCCFGIGIDRLTYALFCQYGCDEASWPKAVKDTLNLSRT